MSHPSHASMTHRCLQEKCSKWRQGSPSTLWLSTPHFLTTRVHCLSRPFGRRKRSSIKCTRGVGLDAIAKLVTRVKLFVILETPLRAENLFMMIIWRIIILLDIPEILIIALSSTGSQSSSVQWMKKPYL